MLKETFETEIKGHVTIKDAKTKEILLDKDNAIHTINMARAFARALAKEPSYYIYRIAFGNGGSFIDAAGQVVLNPPNDGNNGDGWESRLYNETYSEIVNTKIQSEAYVGNLLEVSETSDPFFGQNTTGNGGGSVPADDPSGGGIISQEVGGKSNVIITMYINQNEPTGQLSNASISAPTGEQTDFQLNEMGLYTAGRPPQATNGISSVNIGNKVSTDEFPIPPNSVVNLQITVDGAPYTSQITIPSGGTGAAGAVTYGDFCEGFNNGQWITGQSAVNNVVYVFITDMSGGEYPSIIGAQSGGFLSFKSKTTGATSSVSLGCNASVANDFCNVLTSGICGNVNINQINGQNAGVQNDPINAANERERLLTHLTFNPVLKAADRALEIIYTLTISVKPSQDSVVSINNAN